MENGNRPDFAAMLESFSQLNDDVTHFVVYDKGYYAILRSGRRLDIIRIQSFQPQISDFADYFTYLFVETPDSFLILRQRIIENISDPWEAFLELEPTDPTDFFRNACWSIDLLCAFVNTI
jgi:hypothetical protein